MPEITLDQLAEMYVQQKVLKPKGLKWEPIPPKNNRRSPQQIACESFADIIGFGGAAGGGKTSLIIGLGLTQHKKSIIFRREAKQLREIIDQSREIIGEHGRFNENLLIWRGLPGGKVLEFGGVKDEADVNNWRGRPHDYIAFDELCEFSLMQFLTLTAWNRTTLKGQRCRIVAAFNPPNTAEGQWVIAYFAPWIDPKYPGKRALPGELRWFAVIDGKDVERPDNEPFEHEGRKIIPKSRTFIPAKLTDNPYLADTNYASTLMALDEVQRKQLLDGDFTTLMHDDAEQVIPSAWVDLAIERGKGTRPDVKILSIGIDVSRGGVDASVFAKRYANWIDPLIVFPGSEITSGQAIVSRLINIFEEGAVINIDANSWGSSAYDQLCQLDYNVIGTIAQEGCEDRDKSGKYGFVNVRARDWWHLREMLDPNSGENVRLPDDPEMRADLIAPRYYYRGGKIGVEGKEEIKKRRGKSTDYGDAVVLAMAECSAMPNFRTLG